MKQLLIVLSILFFISCSPKVEVPEDILRQEEMKAVMWDVMRAQYLANQVARTDSLTNISAETKVLTGKVFEIHKISAKDFEKSYSWYLKNPQLMSVIFDSLLVQKQREAYGENERPDANERKLDRKLLLDE